MQVFGRKIFEEDLKKSESNELLSRIKLNRNKALQRRSQKQEKNNF